MVNQVASAQWLEHIKMLLILQGRKDFIDQSIKACDLPVLRNCPLNNVLTGNFFDALDLVLFGIVNSIFTDMALKCTLFPLELLMFPL